MSKPTDLVQGTLDLLILKIVALEPMHGWAIAHRIQQMSSDVLQVGQSALYPALHKLERQGWIKSQWTVSETNRQAKYYSLTRSGRKALAEEAANWERLSSAISAIWSRRTTCSSNLRQSPQGSQRKTTINGLPLLRARTLADS